MKRNIKLNRIVREIIDKRIPCIFISPHLDDAVLSAGDLISYLSDKVEVEVINIFTKASNKPYTLSARAFLYKCGYSDPVKLFTDRIKEDKNAFSLLGVKSKYLGFTDAAFRKMNRIGVLKKVFSNFIPELAHIYPTHRLHITDGSISMQDKKLMASIENKLKRIVNRYKKYYIFCPISENAHVDHKIVKKICGKNFKDVIYWSDYPYDTSNIADKSVRKAFQWQLNFEQKIKLIASYKSQIKLLFPDNRIKVIPEAYYIKK